MNSDYCPPGAADDPDAPYNAPDRKIEAEVTVYLTLSKTFTVATDSYETLGDGPDRSIVFGDLLPDVKSGFVLPHNVAEHLMGLLDKKRPLTERDLQKIVNDTAGWDVCDIEAVPE